MKIELTWIEQKNCSKIVDIPIDEEYLKSLEIEDRYMLSEIINDYYNWNSNLDVELFDYLSNEEKDNYYDDLIAEVLNLEKILDQYSYLIVPEKELTCCEKSEGQNYCSTCGKKLK